ncbi:MAG: FumA C-terminus/TtdB family hydratase beta subunit [Elusimicrobiota bacterium]|jgi:fumarate hydratase subunit beta|nr:FumA C-terminus/TtdB family hydratase beta subunit [Elusimicrobiota bacterium]
MDKKVTVESLILDTNQVKTGDKIYLSGTIYTARDAAHKRIIDILNRGEKPPFEIKNSALYYCGPSPAKPNEIIGACGPTTSSRMDLFTPKMLSCGVKILIGKGARSDEVNKAIAFYNAVYFTAVGGVAALLSKTVRQARLIAFEDLGPEAVYELVVENMPLITAVDSGGASIFNF